MVSLKKRVINGRTYYYLGHSYRQNGVVKRKEIYLGTKLPANIAKIREGFVLDINKQNWFGKLEEIKKAYSLEQKRMPAEVKDKYLANFCLFFTYDTNRIEGSTMSLKDTRDLFDTGVSPNDRSLSDIKETEAHRKVFYEMVSFNGNLSLEVLLKWHNELFSETKRSMSGKLRDFQVYISNSRHLPPPPEFVPEQLQQFFKWLLLEKNKMNPVELAAKAHLRFETIHPFGDGNGRIGRLLMNFILNSNGYPMLDIKYTGRTGYYNALEGSNVRNDETIFVNWFFKTYIKENKRFLSSKI